MTMSAPRCMEGRLAIVGRHVVGTHWSASQGPASEQWWNHSDFIEVLEAARTFNLVLAVRAYCPPELPRPVD